MGAIDSTGLASWDPRGMAVRIYVGDHLTLLYTEYISCVSYGFRFFLIFLLTVYVSHKSPRRGQSHCCSLTRRMDVGESASEISCISVKAPFLNGII